MTFTIGHLVLGVDLSARGDRVLGRAARLPVAPGGQLTIVHAVAAKKLVNAALRAEMARHVTSLSDALRAHGVDAKVHGVIAIGAPHEAVVGQAKLRGAELLAIGDHGARRLRDLVGLGTTADRMVRTADVPVLVVKRMPTSAYTTVALALDLPVSAAAARAAEAALGISSARGRLAAIHAFRPDRRRRGAEDVAHAKLHAWLASKSPGRSSGRVIIRPGDPRSIICRAVGRRFDLVAVGTHGRSNLARWFLGSVAETVLREAPCDVLVAASRSRIDP